jgi:hypothetical protein
MLRALMVTARQSLPGSIARPVLLQRGVGSWARPQLPARRTLAPPPKHTRRQLSFFGDLKKALQEEVSKSKDLKDATAQVQQQFSQTAKSTDKEAAKQAQAAKEAAQQTAEAARKAAEQTADAARKAAAKSQEKLKAATEGTTRQAQEAAQGAKQKVQEMSQQAAKKAGEFVEQTVSKLRSIFSSTLDDAAMRAQKLKERATEAVKEDFDALKSTEEFKNITKEVGDASSKFSETVSKAKAKVSSSQALADDTSLLNAMRRTANEALGETTWKDEFKAIFKPEKKVKKIKLAGVASQQDKKGQQQQQPTYDGPSAVMNVAQPQTGWQAFAQRLGNTPLISKLLEQSREANKKFAETGTGQAVKGAINTTKDLRDELRERWETSQNPWVYRLSGWHDTFFAETETSQAIREVQRLDPDFEIEEFLQALQAETIPLVIQSFVEGNNNQLRHVLGEGAYAMTYAAMKVSDDEREEKEEGVYLEYFLVCLCGFAGFFSKLIVGGSGGGGGACRFRVLPPSDSVHPPLPQPTHIQ